MIVSQSMEVGGRTESWHPDPSSHIGADKGAGTLGRAIPCPLKCSPKVTGKERRAGHQETAKGHGSLMEPEDGKRLPGLPHGGGASLTLSLLISF